MGRRIACGLVVAAATLGLTVALEAPAGAVDTRTTCTDSASGVRTCAGIQTSGGDVRGYARISSGSATHAASVLRVELQRRTCGGSWVTWTTRSGSEGGSATDSLATTYVVRPAGVQFRTTARYVVTSRSSGAASSLSRTSPAYGAC